MEVIGLEGRLTASPWTFCQNWRTLRAVWVLQCESGCRELTLSCYSQANRRLEVCVCVYVCGVEGGQICCTKKGKVNLSQLHTETQLSATHMAPGIKSMVQDNGYYKCWSGLDPTVRLWLSLELRARELLLHKKDCSCAYLEGRPFCLLFLFNITTGSVCPWHCHIWTQWFVFLWWWIE